jgi:hypothetical protein
MSAAELRERSARLLALALKARQDGNDEHSDNLAEMAAYCLDQATTMGEISKSHATRAGLR